MLSWIFKKKKPNPPAIAPAPARAAETAAAAKQAAKQAAAVNVASVWSGRVSSAAGDDAALLALAKEAPTTELKLAAVQAMSTESGLKAAEREFRTHDRRVHQLARQRHAQAKAMREVAERATALIQTAAALLDAPVIPVNRLVEFDRAWQALDASMLSAAHQAEYAALSTQLSAAMQAQDERRAADLAAQARALAEAQLQAAQRVQEAEARAQALQEQEQERQAQEQQGLPAQWAVQPVLANNGEAGTPDAPSAQPDEFPMLGMPSHDESLPDPAMAAPSNAKRAPRRQVNQAEHSAALEAALQHAEAALAEGQLKQVQQYLSQVDRLSADGIGATHRTRLNAIQAEAGRMKGWQQWSGGLARDELVLEAEALAKATAAALEAKGAAEADEATGGPIQIQARAQAEAIDDLRKRWKELDRLAAATSQPLWERFDAALQTAYLPVAAHLAQLEADRQANLELRRGLLDTLDATPLADTDTGTGIDKAPPPWKDLIRALDQFHQAWRKLGPVEHTVPRKAHKALLERLTASVARLEAPLQAARRVAQAEREALVSRAKALSGAEGRMHPAEQVAQVRELQAEWQEHARALPLARPIETSLWDQFKAATDAVFAQREAAFNARDEVLQANMAARLALIERLEAIDPDTPAAEISKTLAQLDAAWRQADEAPRAHAAALEARFRAARAGAQALVAERAQRLWQATCDALQAKLMLCETQESPGAGAQAAEGQADLDARWAALPTLPPLWEQALLQRKARSASPDRQGDDEHVDDTLLQLEAALDLPSPAEHQARRRDLKLRALKAALEGHASAAKPLSVDQLTAELIGRAHLNDAQRQRLHDLIAGLRTGVKPPASSSPSAR
jgi:exonuclease SbcC